MQPPSCEAASCANVEENPLYCQPQYTTSVSHIFLPASDTHMN